jgi:hypothetical protein
MKLQVFRGIAAAVLLPLLSACAQERVFTQPNSAMELIAACLDNLKASYLLFVDADIGFEPQQAERLLAG